uniref:Cocaine- and amphetamine-regulated transcript protein n=1 Tax=Mastacembelus armatus TaxID=205130 RepID=A0A7N8XB66_9TELE
CQDVTEPKVPALHHFYKGGCEERLSINDLHEVLERLQNNQFTSMRKKHGFLPVCDPGDQCALRKGSRIGKLCDCSLPRTCNSFLHRCL